MKIMPKIYDDATLQLVWDMIRVEGMRRSQVAKELCTTGEKIDLIYSAAYTRFGCNQYQNRANQSAKKSIKQDPPKKQIQRPPAVYSNQGWEEYLSK
jgi:hypothetical protein